MTRASRVEGSGRLMRNRASAAAVASAQLLSSVGRDPGTSDRSMPLARADGQGVAAAVGEGLVRRQHDGYRPHPLVLGVDARRLRALVTQRLQGPPELAPGHDDAA